MTPELAALELVAVVRRLLRPSPRERLSEQLPGVYRFPLRKALKDFDDARKQPTSWDVLAGDDEDDLPGSNAPQPVCKFCEKPLTSKRKNKEHCNVTCRVGAFKARKKASTSRSPR